RRAGGRPGPLRRVWRRRVRAEQHEAAGRGSAATRPHRMMEDVTRRGWLRPGGPLRTSQGAAIAGIIFGLLLITALVLLRVSVPARPEMAGAWLADPRRRTAVAVALNL